MSRNYMMPTQPMAVAINGASCWLIFEEDWGRTCRCLMFPRVVWLRVPPAEMRKGVLERLSRFPECDRREEWLCEKPENLTA